MQRRSTTGGMASAKPVVSPDGKAVYLCADHTVSRDLDGGDDAAVGTFLHALNA